MVHDSELLDRIDGLPTEPFDGRVFRATRQSLDPLVSSSSGGRWMPGNSAAGVLYTSLDRNGALAEISFHWSQLSPRPTKPVMVHTLEVIAPRTLKLVRADLSALGVPDDSYPTMNMTRTQEIGAAVEFLGCDGLIAPSARWPCDNLMLFPNNMGSSASFELLSSETVDWLRWATDQGLLK
ncbi:MAG: RES family NAD+ phosphorylase [Candidatus Methylophosphatis roskildensis]